MKNWQRAIASPSSEHQEESQEPKMVNKWERLSEITACIYLVNDSQLLNARDEGVNKYAFKICPNYAKGPVLDLIRTGAQ